MPFLSLSNANVQFAETERPIWRKHTVVTVLCITKRIKLIDMIEFVAATLDEKTKTFIVYVSALLATSIYLSIKVQIRALIAKQTPIEISII